MGDSAECRERIDDFNRKSGPEGAARRKDFPPSLWYGRLHVLAIAYCSMGPGKSGKT